MPNPDDHELVAKAQVGNIEAFDTLYMRHKDRIYGYTLKRVGDPETARDLVQDIFVKAFESLPRTEIRSTFGQWLYGVASHVLGDHFRRQYRQYQWEEPLTISVERSAGFDPIQELEKATDVSDMLAQILTQVSDSHRAVLKLAKLEELPLAEIALKLYGEDNPTTCHRASALIHRALQAAMKIGKRTRKSHCISARPPF